MGFKVAVVGATGNVGREMLATLAEREFPCDEVVALASSRSIGRQVSFGDDDVLDVQDLEHFDFKGIDIVLSSPGAKVSAVFAPRAAKAGAIVIDNTSHWRMDPDVPLVVPEVNPQAIKGYDKKGIIANPNCSTIQMVVALKPLHDEAKIKRVVVATYQSVSGAGRTAMDELFAQTRSIYVNDPIKPEVLTKQIAFNVIPHIDVFMQDGATKEEWKMAVETRKILDPDIAVMATCVRVPGVHRPCARRSISSSPDRSPSKRLAARRCTRFPRHQRRRSPRRRRLRDAGRDRRRGSRLCQPHPQGPDRAERAGDVGRRR